MNPFEIVRVAIRALKRNALRSFLTVLGVVIGVSAVIAMVAIGEGAKAQVAASFAALGSNLLMILPGSTTAGGAHGGFGSLPTLTWSDLEAIRTEVHAVRAAAPVLRANVTVVSEYQNWTTSVNGTTPEFFTIRNWPVSEGRPLLESDEEESAKVAFVGVTVVERLFGPNQAAVGQTIRIRNVPFDIAGVLASKGQSPGGQDYDDVVYVPASTFLTRLQSGLQNYIPGTIMVSATGPETTSLAQAEITRLLRDRHRIPPGEDDDFSIRNLSEFASSREASTRTLTTLLASIAAVSLVVGGIGIMNIMLVSVTERTREIGLRMALGATARDILLQFLIEAITLSFAGGLLGIAIGLLVADRLAVQFAWPMLVRPEIVLLAVGFSAAVGIGFGLYPARKASRLDPIDALRFE